MIVMGGAKETVVVFFSLSSCLGQTLIVEPSRFERSNFRAFLTSRALGNSMNANPLCTLDKRYSFGNLKIESSYILYVMKGVLLLLVEV